MINSGKPLGVGGKLCESTSECFYSAGCQFDTDTYCAMCKKYSLFVNSMSSEKKYLEFAFGKLNWLWKK